MKNGNRWLVVVGVALVAASCMALTIHRSFTTRSVGVGGGVSVGVPVDSRVAAAVDEARAKQAAKEHLLVGKVTRVSDGNTICVTPNGGIKTKVRLNRIDAPGSDQPFGGESTAYLKNLIGGKQVTVKWSKKDRYGRVLGIVWVKCEKCERCEKGEMCEEVVEVNLKMVKEGMAWHYAQYDQTPAYIDAQAEAKAAKRGLWASDTPINPQEWRKRKRATSKVTR